MEHLYRKVSTIEYNDKLFQVFRDEHGKYAFLRIGEDNKLHFPMIDDFIGLIEIFSNRNKGVLFYIDEEKFNENRRKRRKSRFKLALGALVLAEVVGCSSNLMHEVSKHGNLDYTQIEETISIVDSDNKETDIDDEYDIGTVSSNTDTSSTYQEAVEQTPIDYESKVDLSNGYQMPSYTSTNESAYNDNYIEKYSRHQTIIKDTRALYRYLHYESASYDKICEAIDYNPGIPDKYKQVIKDFAKDIMDYYPGIEMRVFYENMKELNIKYVEDSQDQAEAKIDGVEAWYNYYQDNMYISKNLDLSEGSHGLLVFRHELGHALNTARINTDDQILMCSMENQNYGHYIQEAANVIITTYPFKDRYTSTDLGFPLISNEMQLILEATPGYDPRQLVTQNIDCLEEFLDEKNECNIGAEKLFDLMELQTTQYYDSRIKGNTEDYAKIYQYIGEVYVNNVFNDGMSEDEINQYRDYMKSMLTKDLARTETVQLNALDEVIDNYLEQRNVKTR